MKRYLFLITWLITFGLFAQLGPTISQQSGSEPTYEFSAFTNKLAIPDDTTSETVYWFRAYKASAFEGSGVKFDKDYFFLWSTDHDEGGSSGGIWWGDADNLDLSDFTVRGQVFASNYQRETPWPYYFPNNSRKFHLYFHSINSEPGNSGQETRLYSTIGQSYLHECDWIDEGRPLNSLGYQPGQNHTGYWKMWDFDGTLIGYRRNEGNTPTINRAVMSADGKSLISINEEIAGATVQDEWNGTNRYWTNTFGEFFKKAGKYYWVGMVACYAGTVAGVDCTPDDIRQWFILEVNSDGTYKRVVADITSSVSMTAGTMDFYVEGGTIHCYKMPGQIINTGYVEYATIDISKL